MLAYVRQILKISLVQEIEYRQFVFMLFLVSFMSVFVAFFLWSDVYAAGDVVIHGYTKAEIISYYVWMALIFGVITRGLALSEEIRDGKLSIYLTHPYSYISYMYWHFLGRILFALVMTLPVLLGFWFFYGDYLVLPVDFMSYLYFFVGFLLAVNILFFFEFLL